MNKIEYFKLQAKNFMRDFKTQQFDDEGLTFYTPKFFEDIEEFIMEFDIDEENFSLMEAQHIIAYTAGFEKWSDLLHASDAALELGKIIFDNRRKSPCNFLAEDWHMYIRLNKRIFEDMSDESKLELFKAIYMDENNEVII